jgi:hypothetical protein
MGIVFMPAIRNGSPKGVLWIFTEAIPYLYDSQRLCKRRAMK